MRRLVVAVSPTTDDVLKFFYQAGWIYIAEHLPTPGDRTPHTITWAKGEKEEHLVHFVDDILLGVHFFVLESQESDKEAIIESRIRGGPFEFLSPEQIVADFEAATQSSDLTRAFARLVLIAPEEHDQEFKARIGRVLRHQDPVVRAEGLGAVTYLTWPELKPMIRDLARDPDQLVRQHAETILEGYRDLGIG